MLGEGRKGQNVRTTADTFYNAFNCDRVRVMKRDLFGIIRIGLKSPLCARLMCLTTSRRTVTGHL